MGSLLSAPLNIYRYFYPRTASQPYNPKEVGPQFFIINETGFLLHYVTHEGRMPEKSKTSTSSSSTKNSYGGNLSLTPTPSAVELEASRTSESKKEVKSEDGLDLSICSTLEDGKYAYCSNGPYLSFYYEINKDTPRQKIGMLIESRHIVYIKAADDFKCKYLEPQDYPEFAKLDPTKVARDGHQTSGRNQTVVSPSSVSRRTDDGSNQPKSTKTSTRSTRRTMAGKFETAFEGLQDYLVNKLAASLDTGLLTKLQTEGVISGWQKNTIANEKTHLAAQNQVERLLEILIRRDDDKFDTFIDILNELQLTDVAAKLREKVPEA